jgi:hypothetical protein
MPPASWCSPTRKAFLLTGLVASTETFDELPSRTIIRVGSVILDGIAYTSADPSAQWYSWDSFDTVSPPNSVVQRNVIAPATLTFGGGGETDAVSFFLYPGSSFPGGDYRFDLTTVSGETLTVESGIIGDPIFRGFVSSDGINLLSITPLQVPGGLSNLQLDNVSRGAIASAIPEPSSLTLGTTGLLALLASVWRQRTRRMTS